MDQKVAGLWDLSVVVEHIPTARRVVVELHGGVGVRQTIEHVFVVRNTVLGVIDGWSQDLVDGHAAVAFQQRYIRCDDPRDGEGEMGVFSRPSGYAFEPLRFVEVCGGFARCDALPTERQHLVGSGVVEHENALRRQGIRCDGLDNCGRETGGGDGVEGVPAVQEHPHSGHGSEIVTAGDHSLGRSDNRTAGVGKRVIALFQVAHRLILGHD